MPDRINLKGAAEIFREAADVLKEAREHAEATDNLYLATRCAFTNGQCTGAADIINAALRHDQL